MVVMLKTFVFGLLFCFVKFVYPEQCYYVRFDLGSFYSGLIQIHY